MPYCGTALFFTERKEPDQSIIPIPPPFKTRDILTAGKQRCRKRLRRVKKPVLALNIHNHAVIDNGVIVDIQSKHGLFDAPKTLAATLLTGCKNITRLEWRGDGYYALDWRMPLYINGQGTAKDFKYAGARANFLEVVAESGKDGENVAECEILRVIEDTFSIVVLFTNKKSNEKTGYAVMTYELSKEKWEQIKDKPLYLRIPKDKLILMRE